MSVTAARGFRAAGVRAGLKTSGKSDLALVVNDGPFDIAAGVFTTNRVVAAPGVWWRRLRAGQAGAPTPAPGPRACATPRPPPRAPPDS